MLKGCEIDPNKFSCSKKCAKPGILSGSAKCPTDTDNAHADL